MLSDCRNPAAAKGFFRSAKTVTDVIPDRVTTDGRDAYPRVILMELGSRVWHRTNCYLNNHVEQDHSGVKSGCRPMLGLKTVPAARRYCLGHDEFRNFLRSRISHVPRHSPPRRTVLSPQPEYVAHEQLIELAERGGGAEHQVGGDR